ncbi:MAG: M15 family metallopeptidase [Bacilli bacterium]|nr:M15 family metallopeptidase [Bacilli bacterium]
MSKKKKVKLKIKIKKKNFIIFLIIIFLIIFSITKTTSFIVNIIKDNKKEEKVELSPKEKKLLKLENIHKEIDYFNDKYINRYITYKENNPNLKIKQIIKNVNMNLDLTHYEDKIPARNLNNKFILVNKYYYLEEDYVPANLEELSNQYALNNMKMVKEAKDAFEEMSKEAKKSGLKIIAMSTYRDYAYQTDLYNNYVKKDGKEAADTYSGRPGFSEHQTGYAVDVYNDDKSYTDFHLTEEFKWMQENAKDYGFILRFPQGKENETGYQYESWHYRYVGLEAATYITEKNITLEEYYATVIKEW